MSVLPASLSPRSIRVNTMSLTWLCESRMGIKACLCSFVSYSKQCTNTSDQYRTQQTQGQIPPGHSTSTDYKSQYKMAPEGDKSANSDESTSPTQSAELTLDLKNLGVVMSAMISMTGGNRYPNYKTFTNNLVCREYFNEHITKHDVSLQYRDRN